MSLELTRRQQEILDFIRDRIAADGMPPTRVEISAAFGFASPNAAESHLRALAQKGVIRLESGSARGIRLTQEIASAEPAGLPLVGRVAAGSPILAQEHIQRHLPIDPAMFSPRADYLLTVRGLSMINAGILEGDLLAVHRCADARDGQIVVARVEDEVTVKRLKRQPGGVVELIAENPDFSPILVDPRRSALAIEGIAVGLIRDGFTRI
ncbi:transcriptional repressor LexA [Uliginosibacterium sp. 31-16]|uniref:transcriptional repressor LexA n=1 Tax=Uliginosibacterium sp. 31-16 TaxID=3068315 RepID=UPI00273DE56F|nr:transcriptional repressor LexA [Uliginosibacterium sp. 31-16]MDP5239563.1 transcriptional repressor LexA [Uliginosibacterium sp. 31-16]